MQVVLQLLNDMKGDSSFVVRSVTGSHICSICSSR